MWGLRIGIEELLMPPAVSMMFLFLAWSYLRGLNGGRPLDTTQKKMLTYGLLFVLGVLYILVAGHALRWDRPPHIVAGIGWACIVALIAWRRHGRKESG
jgi:hypothetical protein